MSDTIRPPWETGFVPPVKETPEENEAPSTVLRVIPGRKPNGNNKHGKKLARRTLENLTPKMKERRDRFLVEYVRDFNGPEAFIRAGGSATIAVKMASEYLREPYVASQVWAVIDAMEEAELISRKRVIAMFIREANYQGMGASHGARVAAIGHLAKVLGMEQTNVNVKADVKFRGGVMLVPAPDPMSWEAAAAEAQKQLKEDVRK